MSLPTHVLILEQGAKPKAPGPDGAPQVKAGVVSASCEECGASGHLLDPPVFDAVDKVKVLCGPCSADEETQRLTLTETEAGWLADVLALAANGDEDAAADLLAKDTHLAPQLHDRIVSEWDV